MSSSTMEPKSTPTRRTTTEQTRSCLATTKATTSARTIPTISSNQLSSPMTTHTMIPPKATTTAMRIICSWNLFRTSKATMSLRTSDVLATFLKLNVKEEMSVWRSVDFPTTASLISASTTRPTSAGSPITTSQNLNPANFSFQVNLNQSIYSFNTRLISCTKYFLLSYFSFSKQHFSFKIWSQFLNFFRILFVSDKSGPGFWAVFDRRDITDPLIHRRPPSCILARSVN